ncbi:M23 family metallopeptidase [Beijerinckia sp. L45]|uniref:M23 family metallopeptidase n=1 Tax=Beijerinckia sp. L45 TaxID=1641855 RepID=UPI001FEFBA22|nr:M23 family metallopeptidase [Beijerinckia sp. L45]
MSKVRMIFGSRRALQLALAGMTAASLAGCADSDRLASNPLGNPFATASNDRPAPRPDRDDMPYRGAPTSAVSSRPLPAPDRTASISARQQTANYAVPAHESPRLAQAPMPAHDSSTASIATGHGGWSAEGGMPVIAAQGDSAKVLGERYNIPTDALLRANGFTSAAAIRPGTRVIIPVYSASGSAAATHMAAQDKPKHDHSAREKLLAKHEAKAETPHFVKGAQPAAKVADEAHGHGRAEAMKKLAHADKTAPAMAAAKIEKTEPAKKMAAAKVEPVKPMKVAKLETPEPKKAAAPAPVDATPTASLPPQAAVASGSANPEFRWPARGRIIQGFKSGGNDGINIAVPEGTAVKAAESGVVAYAGSEIKGFGNLVLIRHPNGYVSAYANNGSIDVKRGEQVKRGQTIAKSGQSGNVASPQLHFELRKGSTPVDPTQYLAGL